MPPMKIYRQMVAHSRCPDTFFKQPDWLRVSRPWQVLEELAECLPQNEQVRQIYTQLPESTPLSLDCEALFVGNSRAVRVVNRHWPVVDFPIYGNRGTNGIEGSLSVAAGYAMASTGKVLCILGDLSFFYDVNALWNRQLDGRLRILLLNNGRGGHLLCSTRPECVASSAGLRGWPRTKRRRAASQIVIIVFTIRLQPIIWRRPWISTQRLCWPCLLIATSSLKYSSPNNSQLLCEIGSPFVNIKRFCSISSRESPASRSIARAIATLSRRLPSWRFQMP